MWKRRTLPIRQTEIHNYDDTFLADVRKNILGFLQTCLHINKYAVLMNFIHDWRMWIGPKKNENSKVLSFWLFFSLSKKSFNKSKTWLIDKYFLFDNYFLLNFFYLRLDAVFTQGHKILNCLNHPTFSIAIKIFPYRISMTCVIPLCLNWSYRKNKDSEIKFELFAKVPSVY